MGPSAERERVCRRVVGIERHPPAVALAADQIVDVLDAGPRQQVDGGCRCRELSPHGLAIPAFGVRGAADLRRFPARGGVGARSTVVGSAEEPPIGCDLEETCRRGVGTGAEDAGSSERHIRRPCSEAAGQRVERHSDVFCGIRIGPPQRRVAVGAGIRVERVEVGSRTVGIDVHPAIEINDKDGRLWLVCRAGVVVERREADVDPLAVEQTIAVVVNPLRRCGLRLWRRRIS